jgi:hypothetical protein
MRRYRVLGLYRRTVSEVPSLKRLVRVKDPDDAPIAFGEALGALCPDVIFYHLEDQAGGWYWAKRWLNARERLVAPTWQIEAFLATLGRDDLCLAVELSADFGFIYRFDEEVFAASSVIHQVDIGRYFEACERAVIEGFSSVLVGWPSLPWVKVGILTDFQVARTSRGLVFLDFEPSRPYAAALAGVLIP